jgi:hypothetical protein
VEAMSERLRRRARLAAALALVAGSAACARADAQPQLRSMTSARQLSGERRVDVQVEYGAGRLTVEPGEGGLLYRMDVRYDDQRFRPVAAYNRQSGRLRLGMESAHRGRGDRDRDGERRGQRASIALTREVPIALDLEFGAGQAEVELGGLSLESVKIATGASETRVSFSQPNRVAARLVKVDAGAAEITVMRLGNARAERYEFEGGLGEATLDFSGAWSRSATVAVEMGVGSVRLRLPRGLGVRIAKDSFLASFDAPGMVKRGNAWFSSNYSGARVRLDISIDAAIGSIAVEWVD